MIDKKQSRLRRSRRTRAKIAELKVVRLTVNRSNSHIYAQVIDASGGKVLASASSVEKGLRGELKNGGNIKAAAVVGKLIAEKAKKSGCRVSCIRPIGLSFSWPRQGVGRGRA